MRSIMIVWRDSHQPVRAPSMFSDRFTTVSCPPCEPHHSPAFILSPAHANTVHRDPAAPSHDPPIAAFNRLYSRCASRPPRLPPSAPSGLRGFSVRCRNGSVGLEFCRCLPFLPFALPPAKGCYPTLFPGTSLPTLIRNPVRPSFHPTAGLAVVLQNVPSWLTSLPSMSGPSSAAGLVDASTRTT